MQTNTRNEDQPVDHPESTTLSRREVLRAQALKNALRKRAKGVPTYTVPEAAALLSISQEYLYRLVAADGFPAVRMRLSADKGRYVVPAQAVERLLAAATEAASCLDAAEWTAEMQARLAGGAA
jgi:excisionase family DNA binding protein